MGQINIVDRIEKIFARTSNFDESGFAKPELVTPEIASRLARISWEELNDLGQRGYTFKWFNQDQTDGIVIKWFKGPKKINYSLRLYFNQTYPAEIMKGETYGELGD